jgi:hypothetical protein
MPDSSAARLRQRFNSQTMNDRTATDEDARRDGEIEMKVAALDHNVAGQPTKAEPADPRPQEPDDNEHKTNAQTAQRRRRAARPRAR